MKVLGIGDNVVDKYEYKKTMYPGGNALNFSVYAKQLGADSAYLGIFGTDDAANHIKDVLSELKIDTSRCYDIKGESGYALVGLKDGDRIFLESNDGGIRKEQKLNLTDADLQYIKTFDLLHSSKYSYIEDELVKLKETKVRISFDFSDDFTDEYLEKIVPYIDYSFLSCSHLPESEVKALAKKVYDLGSTIVITTLGSKGALLYDGESYLYQQPKLVEAVDTLGAGDSFLTAFLLYYIENETTDSNNILETALVKAADFAAESCLVEGAFGYGKVY